jgi:glycosyltransferase involved in cell wall biosynthesis
LSAPANAAISYNEDSFDPGAQPMGRRTAGQGMLRGFVEHAGVDAFFGYGQFEQDRTGFEAAVRRFGGAGPVHWTDPAGIAGLSRVGALHVAGPVGAAHAFQRRAVDQRAWSLTGVTHTVSTHGAMDAIASLLTGPVQSWDALVCTSHAVRGVVQSVLDDQADYLRARIGGAGPIPTLQLPVIPLGVHCADFAAAPAARAGIRRRLGIDDDAVLVLFAARLSYHAKAHPYPMYQALQQAAERTGAKVHLLLAGWFAGEVQESLFRNGAAELCPSVTLHVLDGREPGVWEAVWQAGDIYTLLSDNIQESFGLSPVEAMAAGLPVVGSDWNGLKDTIADGESGFRVATLSPPSGAGAYISLAYAQTRINYDQFIAATAQVVSIDVPAAADAYAALIADPDLRRRMGEAARARAWAEYDWSRIIPQYQALWSELAGRRAKDAEVAPRRPDRPDNPARADPFRNFAGYPTRTLLGSDRVRPLPEFAAKVEALSGRAGVTPVRGVVLDAGDLGQLVGRLIETPDLTVAALLASCPFAPAARMLRTVTWLHKHGLVVIEPAAVASGG